ncbi:MAG: GFA family protein [Paracoccaceae bacterium]
MDSGPPETGSPETGAPETGGCLCGAVRFAATGRPSRVGLCHCLDCRKHHGAPFHAAATFPAQAVTLSGETRAWGDRHFCPACGSPVFGHFGDEIGLNLGAFDRPGAFRPSYELWTIRREPWLAALPQAHQYEGDRPGPGRSEDWP